MAPGVRHAARIARGLEGRVPNSPKTGETTPVKQALTEADTRAQEALLEALRVHFPEVALAAEEDTPSVDLFAREGEAVVVIDPIDGTLHSYLEGSGPYAVMIGLVFRGAYIAGLVALPREGLLFGGALGEGAWSARVAGRPRKVHAGADGDRILVSHGMPQPVVDYLQQSGFEVVSACGGAVSVAPLIRGVRAGVRYAAGELGVSIRGRIGALIAAESGADTRQCNGTPFPLDLTTKASTLCVTTNAEDSALLGRALAAAGLT